MKLLLFIKKLQSFIKVIIINMRFVNEVPFSERKSLKKSLKKINLSVDEKSGCKLAFMEIYKKSQ